MITIVLPEGQQIVPRLWDTVRSLASVALNVPSPRLQQNINKPITTLSQPQTLNRLDSGLKQPHT